MTGSGTPAAAPLPGEERVALSEAERRRRRARSRAVAFVLGGLVLLFYLVTLAKLGSNVLNRPL